MEGRGRRAEWKGRDWNSRNTSLLDESFYNIQSPPRMLADSASCLERVLAISRAGQERELTMMGILSDMIAAFFSLQSRNIVNVRFN
jgi:hypothetical protein